MRRASTGALYNRPISYWAGSRAAGRIGGGRGGAGGSGASGG